MLHPNLILIKGNSDVTAVYMAQDATGQGSNTVTLGNSELNILDGVTATAELNILDGVTSTELVELLYIVVV